MKHHMTLRNSVKGTGGNTSHGVSLGRDSEPQAEPGRNLIAKLF